MLTAGVPLTWSLACYSDQTALLKSVSLKMSSSLRRFITFDDATFTVLFAGGEQSAFLAYRSFYVEFELVFLDGT